MPSNARAVTVLEALFGEFAGVRAVVGDVGQWQRIDVTLRAGGVSVLPVWAGEGFPEDVRRALLDVRSQTRDAVVVVVAENLSKASRRRLEDEGIGWVDRTGARITAPPVFVAVDRPAGARPSGRRSLWNLTSGAVAETLLVDHTRSGAGARVDAVGGLSTRTGRALAGVSRSLTGFDGAGWTQKEGAARGLGATRRLLEPSDMLSAWGAWHRDRDRSRDTINAHASFRAAEVYVDEVVATLPSGSWCLTGAVSAQQSVPVATTVERVGLYVVPELFDRPEELLAELGARRVTRGARLEIVRAEPHVMAQTEQTGSWPSASAIRVYGDLLRESLRGDEAAAQWREAVVGF